MKTAGMLTLFAAGIISFSSVLFADGESNYKTACFACHDTGVAGSPKLGDMENWAPRIAQGNEMLYQHALAGFQGASGFMPPRGGSGLSDDEIKAVVDYMVSKSQ
ncbi:MAG: cytochrome c5 [Parasphingorhabdus sp.]|jgi:cytochrome c5